YKTMDPRAAALRQVAERLAADAEWLQLAIDVEDVALRLLAEHKPDRLLKTNVEYYASIVLDGVGLLTDLYTPAFAVARTAGWSAPTAAPAARSATRRSAWSRACRRPRRPRPAPAPAAAAARPRRSPTRPRS